MNQSFTITQLGDSNCYFLINNISIMEVQLNKFLTYVLFNAIILDNHSKALSNINSIQKFERCLQPTYSSIALKDRKRTEIPGTKCFLYLSSLSKFSQQLKS